MNIRVRRRGLDGGENYSAKWADLNVYLQRSGLVPGSIKTCMWVQLVCPLFPANTSRSPSLSTSPSARATVWSMSPLPISLPSTKPCSDPNRRFHAASTNASSFVSQLAVVRVGSCSFTSVNSSANGIASVPAHSGYRSGCTSNTVPATPMMITIRCMVSSQ